MSQPVISLQAEKNLSRWQGRLAEAESQLRQRQAESTRLYPHNEGRRADYTAQAAQEVERMRQFVSQGTQILAEASRPMPSPVPAVTPPPPRRGLLARLLSW